MPTKINWDHFVSKLRGCQNDAIISIQKYLSEPYKEKSFLACLPTGAGKTGVIATTCQMISHDHVLVICSRRAVADQLRREIKGDFFKSRGYPGDGLKKVISLINSQWHAPGIYVATFQKLSKLSDEDLERLSSDFDLVVVDEGHSEPAPVWSKISRKFKKHRIIVTATPYRNDLFQFDVDFENNYAYTFTQALDAQVVSRPDFLAINTEQFLGKLKEELDARPDCRAIVKCKSFEDVSACVQIFKKESFKYIALHEQFSGSNEDCTYGNVPKKIRDLDWKIAIHQHMLDEGVDVPEAKVLVLRYAVASGRELVQAVGRIVRFHHAIEPAVLDFSAGSNETLWNNYIDFDRYISNKDSWKIFVRSLDVSGLLKAYLESFPEIGYFGNTFRPRFDINEFEPIDDLRLPLASFCFVEVVDKFSIASFCDHIYWRYHKSGELVRHIADQNGFEIIVSVKFDSSKFLRKSLFFQPTLEIFVVTRIGDYLAIYDSRSINHANDKDLGTKSAVSVDRILNLASRSHSVRTKEARGFAVGRAQFRAERVAAMGPNLEDTNVGQRNSGYAISTLRVDNYDQAEMRDSSYYLGVGSGRVSDQVERNFDLARLKDWIEDIHDALCSQSIVKSELLTSFARPTLDVPVGSPVAVLFDRTGKEELTFVSNGEPIILPSDFIFFALDKDNVLRNKKLTLNACYAVDDKCLEFEVTTKELTGDERLCISEDLNKSWARALYDSSISYVNGKFYKTILPSERGINIQDTKLSSYMYGLSELQREGLSEKGESDKRREYINTKNDSFDANSVFALIDKLREDRTPDDSKGFNSMRDQIAGCDLMICTDMGTEPADFIISSPSKLCFVHVKCGKTNDPKSSAGAIAEVGSQAIKNLENIVSKNSDLGLPNINRLYESWPSGKSNNKLEHRVRLFEGCRAEKLMRDRNWDSRTLVDNVVSEIKRRRASDAYVKEIWLVAGSSFSKSHFIEQMKLGAEATSECLQSFQLLDSWITTSKDQDVPFRIFASP